MDGVWGDENHESCTTVELLSVDHFPPKRYNKINYTAVRMIPAGALRLQTGGRPATPCYGMKHPPWQYLKDEQKRNAWVLASV